MAKYLDPKADVTFKKVFGEHKNLVMSLLNALLPLEEGRQVESIEYLPPGFVPETPLGKDTIVDVRCEETGGRKFIVEMQMEWFPDFKQRVLLNSAKAYVRQLPKDNNYKLRQSARQMKADGLSVETVAKYTGLSAAEIAAL